MPRHHDLTELLGVSAGLLQEVAARPNNIVQDRYDGRLYGDLIQASEELRALQAAHGFATWPALLQDVWATYYKAAPELVDPNLVSPAYRVNREFVQRLLEDPETEATRLTTALDELSAGLATLATGRRLLQEIQQREDLRQALQQAAEAQRRQDAGDGAGAAAAAAEALQQLQGAARDLRRAVREAAQAGQQEARQVEAALRGWGLEPADLQRFPVGKRIELARRLSEPWLRRLADLVGRFRHLARARQRQKIKKQRDELHSISLGADLAHLLPAELAALRHPLRRLDWYRRYQERQLLQYELRAREPQGRGPIVALIDCSGSMAGPPMDWAVATALGLVDTAARQRRQAAAVVFNTQVLLELEFQPGERDPEKVLQLAGVGATGGTDYAPALVRALQLIRSARYRQADVVMVTDGLCILSEQFLDYFLAAKRELGFRVWSVLIGQDPAGELGRWSDRVWSVNELTDEVAGDLFEEVY